MVRGEEEGEGRGGLIMRWVGREKARKGSVDGEGGGGGRGQGEGRGTGGR